MADYKNMTPAERAAHMRSFRKPGTGGRVAEGAPLLRARTNSPVGSTPTPSAIKVKVDGRKVAAAVKQLQERGFGVGMTQVQRDEILRGVNKGRSTP